MSKTVVRYETNNLQVQYLLDQHLLCQVSKDNPRELFEALDENTYKTITQFGYGIINSENKEQIKKNNKLLEEILHELTMLHGLYCTDKKEEITDNHFRLDYSDLIKKIEMKNIKE